MKNDTCLARETFWLLRPLVRRGCRLDAGKGRGGGRLYPCGIEACEATEAEMVARDDG